MRYSAFSGSTVLAVLSLCACATAGRTIPASHPAQDTAAALIWYSGHDERFRSPTLLRVSVRDDKRVQHLSAADFRTPYLLAEVPVVTGPVSVLLSLVTKDADTLATYRFDGRVSRNEIVSVSVQVGGRNPVTRWDFCSLSSPRAVPVRSSPTATTDSMFVIAHVVERQVTVC